MLEFLQDYVKEKVMDLTKSARRYKFLTGEIDKMDTERVKLRDSILKTLAENGDKSVTTLDGVKITSVARQSKGLSFERFKQLASDAGLARVYEICNVVQKRMTTEEKSELVVVGDPSMSIRVSLPPKE